MTFCGQRRILKDKITSVTVFVFHSDCWQQFPAPLSLMLDSSEVLVSSHIRASKDLTFKLDRVLRFVIVARTFEFHALRDINMAARQGFRVGQNRSSFC